MRVKGKIVNPRTHFGWDVARALDERGISITDLADAIGCDQSMVSKLLRGAAKSKRLEAEISKYLGLEESNRIAS